MHPEYNFGDTYGESAIGYRKGIEAVLDGKPLCTLLIAGAFSPNSVRQVVAFTAKYSPNNVVLVDKDQTLIDMCRADGLNVEAVCCDMLKEYSKIPHYSVAVMDHLLRGLNDEHPLTEQEVIKIPYNLLSRQTGPGGLVVVEAISVSPMILLDMEGGPLEENLDTIGFCKEYSNASVQFTTRPTLEQLRQDSYDGMDTYRSDNRVVVFKRK